MPTFAPIPSPLRRSRVLLTAALLAAACNVPAEVDDDPAGDGTETVSQEAFSSTLPSSWTKSAIGSNGAAGRASYDGVAKTFRIEGAGSRIGSTSDNFYFAHRPHSGEGEIVGRVTGFSGANDNARHGIMIRASTATNAPHMFIFQRRNGLLGVSRRTGAGGGTTDTSVTMGTKFHWMKLVRRGAIISAYTSLDGRSWTPGPSATFTGLGNEVRYGLAVSNYDTSKLAKSYVEFVRVHKLPAPWSYKDIGTPVAGGTAFHDYGNGSFKVRGDGQGALKDATGYQFTHRSHRGCHVEMTARLASVTGPTGSAGGLMIRAGLDASAPYAVAYPSGTGVQFTFRTTAGGSSTTRFVPVAGPWIKLVKRSSTTNHFEASTDGVNWQSVGAVNGGSWFNGCGESFLGFFSRSGKSGTTSDAVFDSVTFKTFSPQGPDVAPSINLEIPRPRSFAANHPDVVAGCVTAGEHWVLPYWTYTTNTGIAPIVLGKPSDRPDLFTTTSQKGWKELTGYNRLVLEDAAGNVLASKDTGFCLSDVQPTGTPGVATYDCTNNQGLSPGWNAFYQSSFGCQYFVVDNAPVGVLTVRLTANANRYVVEDLHGTHDPNGSTARAHIMYDPCLEGQRRCDGLTPQVCAADGSWLNGTACPFVCSGGQCTGECVSGSTRCAGPRRETCSQGTWFPSLTCDASCGGVDCGLDGWICVWDQPTYCVRDQEAPATLPICEMRFHQVCDGDPSGEPCDSSRETYNFVYDRTPQGTYTRDQTRYYVCDWDAQTPVAERTWHEGS